VATDTDRGRQPTFDPARLRAALALLDDWSLPSTFGQTSVHHGYRRAALVSSGFWEPAAEAFRFVFDVLAPHDAWVSQIDAGGFIVPHTDASRWRVRWQVPIVPAGVTVVDGEPVDVVAGRPFRVAQYLPHAVWNFTDRPRVHLLIDTAEFVERPPAPFTQFPIPSEYEEAVHGRC
jgi:hypothetical protein